METSRRLAFRVDASFNGVVTQSLYRAYVGPDGDGNVEETVSTALPADGVYDEIVVKAYTGTESPVCDDFTVVRQSAQFGSGTSCVILRAPRAPSPNTPGGPPGLG
jgi:hypothetical protein